VSQTTNDYFNINDHITVRNEYYFCILYFFIINMRFRNKMILTIYFLGTIMGIGLIFLHCNGAIRQQWLWKT